MGKINWANLNYPLLLWITAPVGILLLYFFQYSGWIQFQILTVFTLLYLGIAILHHFHDKTLTFEVIIEYILIAALSLVILQGLLV